MSINEINSAKIPLVRLNAKLEKYSDEILFPKKVNLANKILSKVALP